MKRKSVVALGPGAPSLILIFVVLAMSMLGMLALMNGRNDLKLSERSAQVTQAVYELNARAQESWAQIDDILVRERSLSADDDQYLARIARTLPVEFSLDETSDGAARITWTETDGLRNLHCALEVLPIESEVRARWIRHTLVSKAAEGAEDSSFEEFD